MTNKCLPYAEYFCLCGPIIYAWSKATLRMKLDLTLIFCHCVYVHRCFPQRGKTGSMTTSGCLTHVSFPPHRQRRTTSLIPAFTRYNSFTLHRCKFKWVKQNATSRCNILTVHCSQVLGRTSPFPLILLPQFGGYWIEGTNHEPKDPPEAEQPLCPTSHIKLETNSTAKIYRKHFMGKVRT